jgi:serine protease Do
MSVIEDLHAAVALVGARLGPATVAVGRDARGSGMILADGKVLTNAHHLRDRTMQITFADGQVAQGEVIGVDRDNDLAVLAVDTAGHAPIGWSTEEPAVGRVVFGVARGRHGLRVTFGIVSGVDREFRGPGGRRIAGAVEHTAALARGSSGGPLADAEGQVLGINTHRLGDGFYLAQGAGASLRERVDQLAAGRSPVHRRLGIAVAPAAVARRLRRSVGLPERDGLLVRAVDDGSPAARAGIGVGDLIVAAGGRDTPRTDDLWSVLDGLVGDDDGGVVVDVVVVRGVDELNIRVTFEPAPEPGSAT